MSEIKKIGCVQHDCSDCKKRKKAERKMIKDFKSLTDTVKAYLAWMDIHMKKPSTEQRGKDIAALLNKLEMQNDIARHFGLGMPLGK